VARSVNGVGRHSYYGWRFEVAVDDVTVLCVLNAAGEDGYFTIELDSLLPSWLLSRRVRRAFTACEGAFDALLRRLPEISGVTWS
jgi:hypothetical protein